MGLDFGMLSYGLINSLVFVRDRLSRAALPRDRGEGFFDSLESATCWLDLLFRMSPLILNPPFVCKNNPFFAQNNPLF